MNRARRHRQKDRRADAHTHLNRVQRTRDDGIVERCLFCQPVRNDNEQNHVHGNLIFRPVTGTLQWASTVRRKLDKDKPQEQAVANLAQVFDSQKAMEPQLTPQDVRDGVKKIEKQGAKRGG